MSECPLALPMPCVGMTKENPLSGQAQPFSSLSLTPGEACLSFWSTFSTPGWRLYIQVPETWGRGGERRSIVRPALLI